MLEDANAKTPAHAGVRSDLPGHRHDPPGARSPSMAPGPLVHAQEIRLCAVGHVRRLRAVECSEPEAHCRLLRGSRRAFDPTRCRPSVCISRPNARAARFSAGKAPVNGAGTEV